MQEDPSEEGQVAFADHELWKAKVGRVLHYPLFPSQLLLKQQERNRKGVLWAGAGQRQPTMPTVVVPAPGSPGICCIRGEEGSFLADHKPWLPGGSCRAQLNPKSLQGTFHTTTSKQQHNLLCMA